MKDFLDDDFLLETEPARELFHGYAEDLPIFDFHSHLPAEQIAKNTRFRNLAQIWLHGDHYKWRIMRSNGIGEEYCTGEAPDYEKFLAWARTVPYAIGNPVYHWTHLELKSHFGIRGRILCPDTAEEIWKECNALLSTDEFRARGILERMKVRVLCTTDDPADSLEHHIALAAEEGFGVRVLPAFRPDRVMAVGAGKGYASYLKKLEAAADLEISSFSALKEALAKRHLFFHRNGCRVSDSAVDTPAFAEASGAELEKIFLKGLRGGNVDAREEAKYRTALLLYLGRMNAERNWTMQLHLGALRNVNSSRFAGIGPDSGFDAMGDAPLAVPAAWLLDALERENSLPKTILYVINPSANDRTGALIGCFQNSSRPGRIQFGPAWWFNDTKEGIAKHISALAGLGLLSKFVGMTTDSRSFLSFPRHEYFRRILCNIIGGWAEKGELPGDIPFLGGIVRDICYTNAEKYFSF
ncbi:MAG: glucuronate isomerase [Spirochaetales bacterium]|nr:MAG: glucuronate isomerase [Spirochaetales bacterium]